MSDMTICMNIFASYLTPHFYNKLSYPNSKVAVYYNSFDFEIFSVIPIEEKEVITDLTSFSDYITLLADADTKIEYPDLKIGLVNIDPKNQSTQDSIVLVRLPALLETDKQERIDFLTPRVKGFYIPFWVDYFNAELTVEQDTRDIKKAKETIGQAIEVYCSQNNLERSLISSYHQFVEHIASDLFKFRMSVADEMQLREEAKQLDNGEEVYPEILLRAIDLLEFLK